MKNRIIISIKELNKSNWGLIYQFIKRFYDNSTIDNETFDELKKINAVLKISDMYLNKDVYSEYGYDLQLTTPSSKDETTFAILYEKQNTNRDFSNIVPFYFLHEEFQGKITLGINLDCFSDVTQLSDFTFPCRTFLKIFKDLKPTNGKNTVYFINEKNLDRKTGEITNFRTAIATFRNPNDKNISRYILPLTIIDKDLFYPLFKTKNYENDKIKDFLIAIDKQDETLNDSRLFPRGKENKNLQFRSVFEEWFIKAYFISFQKPNTKKIRFNNIKDSENYIDNINFYGLINLLKSYCENIKELVENIIFHTDDKEGVIYIIFHKKENLTQNQKDGVLNIGSYNDFDRFIEIGIMDFNEKGILDTYKPDTEGTEKPQLLDFFDTQKIHTTGLDRLYLRYAAHLGIKTFANAVKNHNGSFYVESNNNGIKEAIKYYSGQLPENIQTLPYSCNGTHYEIIFPVEQKNNKQNRNEGTVFQYNSFFNTFKDLLNDKQKEKQLTKKNIDFEIIRQNVNQQFNSKTEQAKYIDHISTAIIQENSDNKETIAIKNTDTFDVSLLFKVISFIQLKKNVKRIVLTNLSDSYIDDICNLIKTQLIDNNVDIWSNDHAIILINNKLRYQIICGDTVAKLKDINKKINLQYFNRNYFANVSNTEENTNEIQDVKIADDFLLPYECLIEDNQNTVFANYISDILDNPIEAKNIGCKVSHKNSRIGSKIIIENYYEADFLFQNSFFVERFAYLISKEIINLDCYKNGEKIVMVGFNPYSEPLLKTIMRLINEPKKRDKISTFIIAKDKEKDKGRKRDKEKELELEFKFEDGKEDEITKNPNSYKYITIVPIGSTLSTNDKILSFLKHRIDAEIDKDNFIYNHCTILVRDKKGNELTDKEKKQKWFSVKNKTITTKFGNFKIGDKDYKGVNFLIEKDGIWHLPINTKISFPKEWWKEQPVNKTQNSSLNSQNLFSYPKVAIPKCYVENGTENQFYEETEQKLKELSYFTYFGHIRNGENCQRYYIDTEEYIKSNKKPEFDEWIKNNKSKFNSDITNILVTPDINFESDFINIINEHFFNNNAFILYIDINKWRNNIKDKFSFLQSIANNGNQINFHFIDHALLTSSSYKKAKSYMLSILDKYKSEKKFKFDSVIALINRLSHDRYREIAEFESIPTYSFTHLFIPPSKDPEKDCSLCELDNHYKRLKTLSVLDGCLKIIENDRDKLTQIPFDKYSRHRFVGKRITDKPRYFHRMKLKHRLYFEISNIILEFEKYKKIGNAEDIAELERSILQKLSSIYNECCTEDEKSNEKVIDKKISFLKVISSPPLSHYIKMNYYAHRKLLRELHNTLKIENPDYDVFCLLKVLLKQLSILSSNALVRRDVIVGVWKLYFKIRKQFPDEIDTNNKIKELECSQATDVNMFKQTEIEHLKELKNQLSECKKFNSDFQFFIKNSIHDDEAKSMWLGELLRTGNEIDIQNDESIPAISPTRPDNSLFKEFGDEELRQEYINFLVWLFYDNTTIIRKTLDNFEKEIDKNTTLENMFYDPKDELKSFDELPIDKLKQAYATTIQEQYYYSSIEKYIVSTGYPQKYPDANPDGIDFVQKLIYVLYAKLKLAKLNSEEIQADLFDKNIKSLIEVFVKIMNADAAIFAMKGKITEDTDDIHLISSVGFKDNKMTEIYDIDGQYYTYAKLEQKDVENHPYIYPIVKKYNLSESSYAEKTKLGYEHINFLWINNPLEKEESQNRKPVAVISFLYKNHIDDPKDYDIKSQEHGRLLLLLKKELEKYIKMVLEKKISNLWVEKTESLQKFDKIYGKNRHVFNQVSTEMGKYESLQDTVLQQLCLPWFVLTNQIISFLYANIEKNKPYALSVTKDTLISTHTIGDVFNTTFNTLIQSLLFQKWNNGIKKHVINIIGTNNENVFATYTNDTCIGINKHFIRTFIVQQLDNSLNDNTGHCGITETKTINIVVTNFSIKIIEERIENVIPKESKIDEFISKRNNIKKLNCNRYSSTTLTSLQGVINYMNKNQNNIQYDCDFNFHENKFYVEIIFKNKNYEQE